MFTAEEAAFMQHHGIAEHDVLDVRGYRPVEWKPHAKELECGFVLRDPRHTCGHRLFTRSNNCCMCNPASIAFQLRHTQEGWVYLAYSDWLGAVKVGCTRDLDDRISQLNVQGYGGARDWLVYEQMYVSEMGKVEADIIAAMPGEPISANYSHRFSGERCKEVFETSLRNGRQVFRKITNAAS